MAHGETRLGEKIHFSSINDIQTFDNKEDYHCKVR